MRIALRLAAVATFTVTQAVQPVRATPAMLITDEKGSSAQPATEKDIADMASTLEKALKKSLEDKNLTKGGGAAIARPYIDALQPCVGYLGAIASAAKTNQLGTAVEPAIKGFAVTSRLAMESPVAGSMASAAGKIADANMHLAWSQVIGNKLNGFHVTLGVIATGNAPEARTAVFDGLAASVEGSPTRRRVEQLMQQAYASETREAEKARMKETMQRLNVALEPKQ